MKNRFIAEWIIAVSGILVLGMALGAFRRAHVTKALNGCTNNLLEIETAKEMWSRENSGSTNTLTWGDIRPYLRNETIPICPDGGTYSIGTIRELPTCSIGGTGHSLEPAR